MFRVPFQERWNTWNRWNTLEHVLCNGTYIPEDMLIYHVVLPEAWDEARTKTFYEADSLGSEGFIHCSYADQLDGVIERYYAEAGKIVILSIDADKLTSTLVSEPSTGGEPYPHIYGPINTDAIVDVEERTLRA